MNDWSLYDPRGNRKYLTADERQDFFNAISNSLPRHKRTFALLLYYSGCRITEGLEITCGRVDYKGKGIVFKTLKKNRLDFRFVPLPSLFLEKLDDVHHIKGYIYKKPKKRIWNFNRTTGWSAIKDVMKAANIVRA